MDTCCFCHRPLSDGEVVCVGRGIPGLIAASKERKDGLLQMFEELKNNNATLNVHSECRKSYTRKSTILKDRNSNVLVTEEVVPVVKLRSTLDPFNIERDCLFCGEEASVRRETKKHAKYRRIIYEVATLEFRQSILNETKNKCDEWSETVRARVLNVIDLVAAEAKYHHDCHRKFFCEDESENGRGRPEDPVKKEAFSKLCDFISENDECQFSMSELENILGTECGYSRKTLQNKLRTYFGNSIFITELPGKSAIVNFKGAVGEILYEKWYSDRRADPIHERTRIVQAAADIVREDIRAMVYDTEVYPPADSDLDDEALLPESTRLFLERIVQTKSKDKEAVRVKRAALGQALVAACRPRSFVSPILLGVGVYIYTRIESKELIEKLHKYGYSVDYHEARSYAFSAMEQEAAARESVEDKSFRHFAFDNADLNVRTLVGLGTFHSLGGVRFRSVPIGEAPISHSFPRVRNPPPAKTIATRGSLPIAWFTVPSKPGLKGITVQDLRAVSEQTSRSVNASLRFDSLCLAGLWAGVPEPPSWNGFIRAVASGEARGFRTQVEALPFINLSPSDPSALYTALRYAQEECRKIGQRNCLVTFDQPLFAKASEIVASSTPELDNVTVRLGGFHLLMSFLGSIGYIMSGSGLEQLWTEVYAKLSVAHMMSGHAYSRCVRAHFLTETALITMLLQLLSPELVLELRDVLKSLFLGALDGSISADELADSSAVRRLHLALDEKKKELSAASPTAKLWCQYLSLVEIVRLFIRAERTGNWDLHCYCVDQMLAILHSAGHFPYAKSTHLYLQIMSDLKNKLTDEEYKIFVIQGQFAVWRKDDIFGGVWTDMSIEQDLMRAFKVHGGLSHGRGVEDSQLAYFVLAFPACLKICRALERSTGKKAVSSEQHVDLRPSRRAVDSKHIAIFLSWLSERSPWTPTNQLHSLSSGVIGTEKINCHMAREIGTETLRNITGTFGDIKLTKKNRVLPLSAVHNVVKIRDELVPVVDSRQLFNRLVWAIRSKEGDSLKESMKYELALRPPALFDDFSLRKNTKSTLAHMFASSPPHEDICKDKSVVVDGGYLLHSFVWPKTASVTYGTIVSSYVKHVQRRFSQSAQVVFDGYENGMSTKGEEQRRRAGKKKCTDIVVEENKLTSTTQADFLSNSRNKTGLISLMTVKFNQSGMVVHQAPGDADTLVVRTALERLAMGQSVVVVATDTDIAVMLVAMATVPHNKKLYVLHPPTSQVAGKLFDVQKVQTQLGPAVQKCLLFVHAFSGSDTTSAIFKKGKKTAMNKILTSPDLRECAAFFSGSEATLEQIKNAGETFMISLYTTSDGFESLDELRCCLYAKSLKRRKAIDLESLPPTSAACLQHSLRTYLQVQEWIRNPLPPTEWGWKISNGELLPVPTKLAAAPDFLLNLISCGCETGCGPRCSCRTSGMKCDIMCAPCRGRSCMNVKEPDMSSAEQDDQEPENDEHEEDPDDPGAL